MPAVDTFDAVQMPMPRTSTPEHMAVQYGLYSVYVIFVHGLSEFRFTHCLAAFADAINIIVEHKNKRFFISLSPLNCFLFANKQKPLRKCGGQEVEDNQSNCVVYLVFHNPPDTVSQENLLFSLHIPSATDNWYAFRYDCGSSHPIMAKSP